MKTGFRAGIFALALVAMTLGFSARAREMTAFELVKDGNSYVGADVQDQIVEIRSERSNGTLAPTVWFLVYYQPDATFHSTEVKFISGKKQNVTRPMRMLEFGNGDEKTLDRKKLNVDSDRALEIASKEPLLANITLKASQFTLQHSDEGPVWKIRLWAAKTRNPNDLADVGTIYIQTDDGKVKKSDLHPEHIN